MANGGPSASLINWGSPWTFLPLPNAIALRRQIPPNGNIDPDHLPDAFAYRVNEVPLMGGPCRTKLYALAKQGKLKLVRVAGRTLVDGDSLRELLRKRRGGDIWRRMAIS